MAVTAGVFNEIPTALRTPGVYVEFDNRLANSGVWQSRLLVLGLRDPDTAEKDEFSVDRVTSAEQAERYYGRGSMLAEMVRAALEVDPYLELYAQPLDAPVAAAEATGSITAAGPALVAGTISLYIAGYRIRVGVDAGDNSEALALAIEAAINADDRVPVTAALDDTDPTQVNLTARWAGETGNDIHLAESVRGEPTVRGVSLTLTQLADGSANPELGDAIAEWGDEWFHYIACPFTDVANLDELGDELDRRWGPMVQMGGRAFCAYRGSHSETGDFGSGRNNPHVTVMGTGQAVSPTWLWAATNAMVGAGALTNDPARPLQRLELPRLIGPRQEDLWTQAERNLLLFDGIATYTVAMDGTVQIERQVTTYQENASGVADDSYLDINTPETLERIRYEQRSRFLSKYPRHKLASDDDAGLYGAGQPIMTPRLAKAELLDLYRDFLQSGWVQGYESYAESLNVNIDPDDPTRLNIIDSPQLIGQYRVHAQQVQFRR
ncbi:phage tail sheath subtilisin-like domain-containing protein [Thioalkalivibrio sp. ALMg9]|uniref:phage tail sheath subtilisin-like domain-containing protein n=1 Tax=Thioalkalivibrio sp. ALMg9 TaxID=1266912 RepID=UPI00038131AB|nr:phage tail sheath subtilisin-like domain-containing protein [Thioalkalivibrio sp. ALMg9]